MQLSVIGLALRSLMYSILPLVLAASAGRAQSFPPADLPVRTSSQPSELLKLGSIWRFKTDPEQVGTRADAMWAAEHFDDTSWKVFQSGRSWESQGVVYSGYAWYRQQLEVPKSFEGKPLKLTLADIYSDDDVYFNGVRIGGLKGEYKYKNLLLRVYTIPAGLAHPGAINTIAIRLWGGRLGSQGAKSGLVAGPYTIEAVPFGLAASDIGDAPEKAGPLQLYDLSDAQRGRPFNLVFRFDLPTSRLHGVEFSYKLTDFYGDTLEAGEAPVDEVGGVSTGTVRISSQTARKLYLAGRFKALAVLKDTATGAVLSQNILAADHLCFAKRDDRQLPPLSEIRELTPYGSLKLVDIVNAATPDNAELHPYLESGFGTHAQDFMTPGTKAEVTVRTILGQAAREPIWSWFAYRIGRGKLMPGHTYLVRISYPEDKPRYAPIGIESGQDFMNVGWKTGIAADDVYDNFPLSHAWQYYDIIVPLGTETTGAGGAGDGHGELGFWIYFMDQRKPGAYFSDYQGGAAVSMIKLYEIDPTADAPHLILPPDGLPRRTMTVDWERQPTAPPADLVAYARLMGYSALSPTILKWGLTNYAAPSRGYMSASVDAAHYWEMTPPVRTSTQSTSSQVKSVHERYIDATRGSGIDYIPRIEYGGSSVLPVWARAIGSDGRTAKPDRFAAWGADLLRPETLSDFKSYLDGLIRPYAASNPQLKGILWRSRQDRMQISYSRENIALFAREAEVLPPVGLEALSSAEVAEWATTPPIAPQYVAWWQKRRADFQQQVAQTLEAYRPDLALLYFNWDQDKFSLLEPDRLSSAFAAKIQREGGPAAYLEDRTNRQKYTIADYTNVFTAGNFSGSLPQIRRSSPWPDYALLPSLYANIKGVQLLAPVPGLPYANMLGYINYFRTAEGVAVSHVVSYDEIGAREPNPKYEGAMVLPGGAPFSMSVELLAYFYGDVRTLTYTVYTYGRGFADAHRRFAQAFRALPAIRGDLIAGTPPDVAVRTYTAKSGQIYLGIAYKGYRARSFSIDVPGKWSKNAKITNLVTGKALQAKLVGDKIHFDIDAGAMQLDAYVVQ